MKKYEVLLPRDEYYHRHHEILDWCNQHFGSNPVMWRWEEAFGNIYMTFYEEKDYNWFLLKWQ